ncbi:OapA family protein [Oleiagrimonas soli]|uniref:Murein DD-endopeptidase MepM/ murein hydrolase activator NlpD n=1 Tax=Oleiagrimonas soli TaxID=1543381 RepID=A0A099CZJ8_9GAMM|nr:peptidoglycan DD-metalloendopeptidase family protein [Oleiagrimonas soli]KGI79214.1 peptidase M23 [Oleiagrimonas soli]MBB6184900.1 murein DD-endopeptidase MepM/ murein hydrolase activator NlpD [Oleiagrimonas soli]
MARGPSVAHHARRQAMRRKAQRRHQHFYQRYTHWSLGPSDPGPPLHWSRERWMLGAAAVLLVVLSALIMPAWASAMKHRSTVTTYTEMPLDLPVLPPQPARKPVENWQVMRVQPGQTLSGLFESHGLDYSDLNLALQATKKSGTLHDLHPGDEFAYLTDANGALEALRFDADGGHRVTLRFANGEVTRHVQARELERREHIAHGVIQSSLFGAASQAGLSEAMVVKLADVFKYDIDFIKDIRSGDRFTVVYDDVWRDGAYLHGGDIIAAEFYNRGQRYTAFRFQRPDGTFGYYSEDGRPLQKALLRTPVKFSRISSRFSLARNHPILGYTRAHKGVDYAAPRGTPIHAAGNGVIRYRGWERGFGRFILIKHDAKYSTAYAHMSRFAPGLHVGSRVSQGQVIGYVGMTGLATGPHLHYEVRVNGHQVNPLTVTMPKPKPLEPKLLAQFKQQMQPMLARIDTLDANIRLANRSDAGKRTPQTD